MEEPRGPAVGEAVICTDIELLVDLSALEIDGWPSGNENADHGPETGDEDLGGEECCKGVADVDLVPITPENGDLNRYK